jgi:hypothetical protein
MQFDAAGFAWGSAHEHGRGAERPGPKMGVRKKIVIYEFSLSSKPQED